MSMNHQTVIKMSVQQMVCTGCGAEANASCNCGKAYLPKKQRAAEAIAANPQKSDRAIAEELGVSDRTVNRARDESGATYVAPEREGQDGKTYRLPVREEPEDESIEAEIEPDNRRTAFALRADQARIFAAYSGPVDSDVLELAQAAAQAWETLASDLQRKLGDTSGPQREGADA